MHYCAVAITKKSAKQFCSFAGVNSYLRTLKIRYVLNLGFPCCVSGSVPLATDATLPTAATRFGWPGARVRPHRTPQGSQTTRAPSARTTCNLVTALSLPSASSLTVRVNFKGQHQVCKLTHFVLFTTLCNRSLICLEAPFFSVPSSNPLSLRHLKGFFELTLCQGP